MLTVDIPGLGPRRWEHLVLDLNGTLTAGGALIPGVAERLSRLADRMTLHLVTADTRGTADALAARLHARVLRIGEGSETEQKRGAVEKLGAERVVAIGNGRNDEGMLSAAGLGLAIVGPEGAAGPTLLAADAIFCDVCDALDMLLDTPRLIATLRK